MIDRLKVSSEFLVEVIPIIKHINSGFDYLVMGIQKHKVHIIADGKKHFKRAGVESYEILLIEAGKETKTFLQMLEQIKIVDHHVTKWKQKWLEFSEKVTGLITEIRGVKSDLTEQSSTDIKIEDFDAIIQNSQELYNEYEKELSDYSGDYRILELKSDAEFKKIREQQRESLKQRFIGIFGAVIIGVIANNTGPLIASWIWDVLFGIMVALVFLPEIIKVFRFKRTKCKKCQKLIWSNSIFCNYCGTEQTLHQNT